MPKKPLPYSGNIREAARPVSFGMTRRASRSASLAMACDRAPLSPATSTISRSGCAEMTISWVSRSAAIRPPWGW